jgi:hypothetical protein
MGRMIVYELACAQEHRFEGWFASAEDYASQRERSLVRCPLCDDDAIERRPSANVHVRVQKRAGKRSGRARAVEAAGETAESAAAAPATPATDAQVPDVRGEVLKVLRAMVAASDDVGTAFAEEARKIHYEEAPARSIRGQASPEEAADLREEGIDFLSVPDVLTSKLQ